MMTTPSNPVVTLQPGVFNIETKCPTCGAITVANAGEVILQGMFKDSDGSTKVVNIVLTIQPGNP